MSKIELEELDLSTTDVRLSKLQVEELDLATTNLRFSKLQVEALVFDQIGRNLPLTAPLMARRTRNAPLSTELLVYAERSLGLSSPLELSGARGVPLTTNLIGRADAVPLVAPLQSLGVTRSLALTAPLGLLNQTRPIPLTAATLRTSARSVPISTPLQALGRTRSIALTSRLQALGSTRAVSLTGRLMNRLTRSVPITSPLRGTRTRSLPLNFYPSVTQAGRSVALTGQFFRGSYVPLLAPFESDSRARVTQVAWESIERGTPSARVDQAAFEAVGRVTPPARVDQTAFEAVGRVTPPARLTQFAFEAAERVSPAAQVGQFVEELVMRGPPPPADVEQTMVEVLVRGAPWQMGSASLLVSNPQLVEQGKAWLHVVSPNEREQESKAAVQVVWPLPKPVPPLPNPTQPPTVIVVPPPAPAVAAPTVAPALATATTGGSLPAGTYTLAYTWVTSRGESAAGPTATITTTGSTSTITLTPPAFPAGVIGYIVYMAPPNVTTPLFRQSGVMPITAASYTVGAIATSTPMPPQLPGGTYAPGTYEIGYTYTSPNGGETLISPMQTVTVTVPNSSFELTLPSSLPLGTTGVQAYISGPNPAPESIPCKQYTRPVETTQLVPPGSVHIGFPADSLIAATNWHENNDPEFVPNYTVLRDDQGIMRYLGTGQYADEGTRVDPVTGEYEDVGEYPRDFGAPGQIRWFQPGYPWGGFASGLPYYKQLPFVLPSVVELGADPTLYGNRIPPGSDPVWPDPPSHVPDMDAGGLSNEAAYFIAQFDRPSPPPGATDTVVGIELLINSNYENANFAWLNGEPMPRYRDANVISDRTGFIEEWTYNPIPDGNNNTNGGVDVFWPQSGQGGQSWGGPYIRMELWDSEDPWAGAQPDLPTGNIVAVLSQNFPGAPDASGTAAESWCAFGIRYRFALPKNQGPIYVVSTAFAVGCCLTPPPANTTGEQVQELFPGPHNLAHEYVGDEDELDGTQRWSTLGTQMIVVRSGDRVPNVGPFQNQPGPGLARVWNAGLDGNQPPLDAQGRFWFDPDYDDSAWDHAAGGFETDLVYHTADRGPTLYVPYWPGVPTAPPITAAVGDKYSGDWPSQATETNGRDAHIIVEGEVYYFRQTWQQPAGTPVDDALLTLRWSFGVTEIMVNKYFLGETGASSSYGGSDFWDTWECTVPRTQLRTGTNVIALRVVQPNSQALPDTFGAPKHNCQGPFGIVTVPVAQDMPIGGPPLWNVNQSPNATSMILGGLTDPGGWRPSHIYGQPQTRKFWEFAIFMSIGEGYSDAPPPGGQRGPGFYGSYGTIHVPSFQVWSMTGLDSKSMAYQKSLTDGTNPDHQPLKLNLRSAMGPTSWPWMPPNFGFGAGDTYVDPPSPYRLGQAGGWGFKVGERLWQACASRYAGSPLGYIFGGGRVHLEMLDMLTDDERSPGVSYLLTYGFEGAAEGYRERTIYNGGVSSGPLYGQFPIYAGEYAGAPVIGYGGSLLGTFAVKDLLDVYVSVSVYRPFYYKAGDARIAVKWLDANMVVQGHINPADASGDSPYGNPDGSMVLHHWAESIMCCASEDGGASGNWQSAAYLQIWIWGHEASVDKNGPLGNAWMVNVTVREKAPPSVTAPPFAAVLG